ncbi:hypothetical protein [Massilistercora timonensis]
MCFNFGYLPGGDHRVMSIPTLAVFKDGEMVKREVGAKSKAEILEMLG